MMEIPRRTRSALLRYYKNTDWKDFYLSLRCCVREETGWEKVKAVGEMTMRLSSSLIDTGCAGEADQAKRCELRPSKDVARGCIPAVRGKQLFAAAKADQ